VGRTNRENGLEVLVAAFARAARELAGVELHLVGEGPERPPLEALAGQLGVSDRLVWHGWVDTGQLADLYSAADLFVFSAFAAGLPRVVLEAMACGAPVLATTVSGVTDHVVDGLTGYLVEPRSAEAMAQKIADVLSDPAGRARTAEAGMRHVVDHLSWEAIVRQIVELIYLPISRAAAPSTPS
jgi:glycosyltransferase involved in cell wall biosynthesis